MENHAAISSYNNENCLKKVSQENSVWSRIKNQFLQTVDNNKDRKPSKKASTPQIYIDSTADAEGSMSGSQVYRKQSEYISRSHIDPSRLTTDTSRSHRLSKSEQTLNRLLRDQLQLAYSDHQNNMRTAQSYAAIQQLRKSQPRLEITQSASPSRHASPSRANMSRNQSPHSPRRGHSPLTHKVSDGWSSGSEQSCTSNKSAPPGYRQAVRLQSAPTSGKNTPLTLSPTHQSQTRSRPGSPRGSNAGQTGVQTGVTASNSNDMIKHAHINLLWTFILDAITSTPHLDNYGEVEPRIWWRRLFHILKYKHGKGKIL